MAPIERNQPGLLQKMLYALLWSSIWPVIIGSVVFIAAANLLPQSRQLLDNDYILNKTVAANTVYYLELAIFSLGTLLVGIFLLIKLLLGTRKHLLLRVGAGVLSFYIWVGVFAAGAAMVYAAKGPEVTQPQPTTTQDLRSVVESVGGKSDLLEGVLLYYVDSYDQEGRFGEYMHVQDGDTGQFLYGTITVKRGIDSAQLKTVAAHEYLHHIWNVHLDKAAVDSLTNQLTALYEKDSWMQHRMNEFPDGNYQLPTELFSLYCTEVPDAYLSKDVLDTCNEYIDRSTLTFMRI